MTTQDPTQPSLPVLPEERQPAETPAESPEHPIEDPPPDAPIPNASGAEDPPPPYDPGVPRPTA
jgi:hypothetical protein